MKYTPNEISATFLSFYIKSKSTPPDPSTTEKFMNSFKVGEQTTIQVTAHHSPENFRKILSVELGFYKHL